MAVQYVIFTPWTDDFLGFPSSGIKVVPITKPSGTTDSDFLLAYCFVTNTATVVMPAGWSPVASINVAANALYIFWAKGDITPGSATITEPGHPSSTTSFFAITAQYTGVDVNNPIDSAAIQNDGSASPAGSASLTTSTNNTSLELGWFVEVTSGGPTINTAFPLIDRGGNNTFGTAPDRGGAQLAGVLQQDAGATGSKSATVTGSSPLTLVSIVGLRIPVQDWGTPQDSTPTSLQAQFASSSPVEDTFTLNDSAPTPLAQTFASAAAAWTNSDWLAMLGMGQAAEQSGVLPGTGSLVLTGLAPSVVIDNRITIGVGALVLTGLAPSVVITTVVQAGVGSLLLTGFAPSIVIDNRIAVGVGALTLTGFAPSVVIDNRISTGVGALLLTGLAPSIVIDNRIAAGVGSLLLTGLAPSVVIDNRIAAGAGALALTGFAPTVSIGVSVLPGKGDLVLTGFAPSINISIFPAEGDLVLTGFPPSVVVIAPAGDVSVFPDTGQLILEGFAPEVISSNPPDVTLAELRRRALIDPEEEERLKKEKPYADILDTIEVAPEVVIPTIKAQAVQPIKARAVLKARTVLKAQTVIQAEVVTVHEVTAHTVHEATAIPIIDPLRKKTIFGRLIRTVKGRLSGKDV